MKKAAMKTEKVVDVLPHLFGRNESVPALLVGATIIAFGMFENSQLVEGGGLVVDFRPANSDEIRRAVFAFSDVAMWVEMETPLSEEHSAAADLAPHRS